MPPSLAGRRPDVAFDPAAEIAQAIVEDRTFPWDDMPAAGRLIVRRWPDATPEEIRRAVAIAVEVVMADAPRLRPPA